MYFASHTALLMNENIVTCLRIKETAEKPQFSRTQIRIQNKTFTVDNILYGPDQETMFHFISRTILTKCIQGYNCTVFAYGQTGSGKTYTIQGTEDTPGLIQRSLAFLHNNNDTVKLSFVEIYNENMIDLFNPENEISVREGPVEGVVVDNLSVFTADSLSKSLEFYNTGIANRKTAATQMNENSSRSHSIFTISLEIKDKYVARRSKLCFVDLAGSEKIGDNETERVKEMCNINKSLLCLGKIVQKLSSNDRWHISYRDSKLTFLLKDSLGGNCKLAIVGTVNLEYPSDTINTLSFLNRSKMISNTPSINYNTEAVTIEELTASLRELSEENALLKAELADSCTQKNCSVCSSIRYDLNRLKAFASTLGDGVGKVSKIADMLVDNYFDVSQRKLVEMNERLQVIAEQNKENIRDMWRKRMADGG